MIVDEILHKCIFESEVYYAKPFLLTSLFVTYKKNAYKFASILYFSETIYQLYDEYTTPSRPRYPYIMYVCPPNLIDKSSNFLLTIISKWDMGSEYYKEGI